ncbi:MAG: Rap1a/Tai family immunity protein [Candidatus Acidiferrum sp.]
MKLALVISLILGIFSPQTIAQDDIKVFVRGGNTEAFLSNCEAVERMDMRDKLAPAKDASGLSFCLGYIAGLVDMRNTLNSASGTKAGYCVADSASTTQLTKIVVKYGHDHPEKLNLPPLFVVTEAFAQAFPCQ